MARSRSGMPRSIQVGVPSGWFSVTRLIVRSSGVGVAVGVAQPMPAGGRSDQHERACSFPSLPDDGGGLPPVLDLRAVRPVFQPLFVNAEPVSLGVACLDDVKATIEEGRGR